MNFWPLPTHVIMEMLFGAVSIAVVLKLLGNGLAGAKENGRKKRLAFLDFAKGGSILSMILIHVSNKASAGIVLNDFIWFGVPLFVFCSGYLLMRRYGNGLEIGSYFRKAFFRVVLPYVIVSLVLHMAAHGWFVNPQELLLDLVFGRLNGYNLYFIPVMIQFYLLFPLMAKYRVEILSWAGVMAAFAFSVLMNFEDGLIRQPLWNSDLLALIFFGRYAFYFIFGAYLSRLDFEAVGAGKSAFAALAFAAGTAALAQFAGSLYLGYLFPILWLFLMHLAYVGGKKLGAGAAWKGIEMLGIFALAIYLVHTTILDSIAPFAEGFFSGWPLYFALFLLTAIASLLAAAIFMAAYKLATAKWNAPAG